MVEKADGYGGPGVHKKLKKQKNREERRKSKSELHKGNEPIETYGKYTGWEA